MSCPSPLTMVARILFIGAMLWAWFWSQGLIGARELPPLTTTGTYNGSCHYIGDKIHDVLTPWTEYLAENDEAADMLLISSSVVIDIFGLLMLGLSIFGSSVRPIVSLLLLFGLRQIMQGVCVLSAPTGVIWRDPGFPSLFVTYDVANDYFFSGHTGIATIVCIELMRLGNGFKWGSGSLPLTILAFSVLAFEATTVLVLRAHWTMDVFAGLVAARYATIVAYWIAPSIDRLLGKPQPVATEQGGNKTKSS